MPLLLILKNAIGAIALYYIKKNAPELLVDFSIEGLDKLAGLTSTEIDDTQVAKIKRDKAAYVEIVRGFL